MIRKILNLFKKKRIPLKEIIKVPKSSFCEHDPLIVTEEMRKHAQDLIDGKYDHLSTDECTGILSFGKR